MGQLYCYRMAGVCVKPSLLLEYLFGARMARTNRHMQDATEQFNRVHPSSYLSDLPEGSCLGPLDPATSSALNTPRLASDKAAGAKDDAVCHPSLCVTLSDFEPEAKKVLPRKAWVYASSFASSGVAMRNNLDDWSLVHFRPRVLRNVENVDLRTKILGQDSLVPFFVPPMGTLGNLHPGAEPEMVRGLVRKGILGVVSTASSKPAEDIMQSFVDEQKVFDNTSPSRLFFQLYVPMDRTRARALIHKVRAAGYQGLWITVDTPVLGKRTADTRLQAEEALATGLQEKPTAARPKKENSFGVVSGGRAAAGQLSPNLTWEDIKWIRKEWQGPIVLKGIQNADDAKLALDYGCQGILLSNHAGRQLHSAPSSLVTLLEIRTYYPELIGKIEIYVDGGLRDGADILKAVCLGATAVGIGRPFLYALAAYGSDGVERCADGTLQKEIQP